MAGFRGRIGKGKVAILISNIKLEGSNEVDLSMFCLRVVFIQGLHHIWDKGQNSQLPILNLSQKVNVFQGSVTGPLA